MTDSNVPVPVRPAPIKAQVPVPQTYTEIIQLGRILAASGYFTDAKTEAQAVAKIIAGAEAGFGPMASLTGIHIVQGKPTFGANLMAAAVKRSGRYDYKVRRLDNEACILEFFEGGKPVGTSAFTIDEAKAANLTGKDIWKAYPRNLLFARAMSNGVRWYCPDVFGGAPAYTPEELGAEVMIDEHGEQLVQEAPAPPKLEETSEAADEAKDIQTENGRGQNGQEETYWCASCGGEIVETVVNNQKFTPSRIVVISRRDFGEALCVPCYQARKRG